MGRAVKMLQKVIGTTPDGSYGPITAARLWSLCADDLTLSSDPVVTAARDEIAGQYGSTTGDVVQIASRRIAIGSSRVPLWIVPYQMDRLPHGPRRQRPVSAILHHDAAGSARDCYRILLQRGLSTHFAIDDNGVILQFLDPATDVAWHAAGQYREVDGRVIDAGWNSRSIGIDLSNPVLPDSASGRADRGREVQTLDVQGRPYRGLDFYSCQEEAALALLKLLRSHFPDVTTDHRTDAQWRGDLRPNTPGVWGHCQVSNQKIDPFGFPFNRLNELEIAQ